jgi:hypothetical protein
MKINKVSKENKRKENRKKWGVHMQLDPTLTKSGGPDPGTPTGSPPVSMAHAFEQSTYDNS